MMQEAESGVTQNKGKLRKAKKKEKKSGQWHIALGDRLIQQGKIEQALAEYHKALEIILK